MTPIFSDVYDGRNRWLWSKDCEICQTQFHLPKNQLLKRSTCSKKCRGIKRQRRTQLICATCGKAFKRKTSDLKNARNKIYFCSRLCKDEAQRLEGIKKIQPLHYGTGDGKAYLIRKRGHKCQTCGLSEWRGQPILLELHHIDGDALNRSEDNTLLLCPNCHAQTPNYRGRNKGFGRATRKMGSALGASRSPKPAL